MKVNVLKEFTGYPAGVKTVFQTGHQQIAKAYVAEANLVPKGLVEPLPVSDTSLEKPA